MSDSERPPDGPQQPRRPRPERDRPGTARPNAGKVPALDSRDLDYGFGQKKDVFDAELERDLEVDVQAAMAGISDSDLRELFGDGPGGRARSKAPEGGPKKGKVISVRGKDVFVDVGGRTQGVLALQQFPEGPPAIGTEVEVHIEGYDPDGVLLLNRQGAAVEADWSSVAAGMTVEARVTATNKGGLSVDINGIRGFMPISQIDLYRVEDTAPYVNQRLLCLVTEVDREERNLVVSRRALLERDREQGREKLWAELGEGQLREGIVRTVKPFGAFVDLGGADGLLPTGEMSWQRVNDPLDVVQPGQRVRVVILRLDRDARKITLGLRQLTTSPWDEAAADYPPGTTLRGKVTRTAEFGAFVEIIPGVEGLVHISELAAARVRRVTDVVKVGEEVSVKVLGIDPAARRLALSIKEAQKAPPPEVESEEEEAPAPPPRKRTTPLRGGVGGKLIDLPKPEDEEG